MKVCTDKCTLALIHKLIDNIRQYPNITLKVRPKIRPKNGFFSYVPFLGLILWIIFCSNCNPLTFDLKVYIWNNLSGEKNIVIVSPLPLVGAHTKICPKYLFVCFCCFTSHVNSYGHCGTVSLLNHTFSWAGLSKRLTSNLCTYFRL